MLNIAMYQVNTQIFQVIKIDDLLGNPEVKVNSGNLSDDDQIEIFNTRKIRFFCFIIILI